MYMYILLHCPSVLQDKQTPLHYASFGGFSKFPTYNKLLGILLQYNANANQPGDVSVIVHSSVCSYSYWMVTILFQILITSSH